MDCYYYNLLIENETESGKEPKGDINISVVVIGNFCYAGEIKGIRLHRVSDHCLFINVLYLAQF